jgi:hypothetical protein
MRRTNRLSRFHMVSADGENWVSATELTEVFQTNLDLPVQPVGSLAAGAGAGAAAWLYLMGGDVHGPISGTELQELIDSGAVGPDVLVRRTHESQWSRCDQVGGFRFGPPPGEPATEGRAGLPTGWIAGLVLVFTVAVLLLCGWIAWQAQVGARRARIEAEELARNESARREAATRPAELPTPKTPEPAKEPGPVASAPPKPEPEPEPDPATAPVKEVKFADVDLPRESVSVARHDSAERNLAVALPAARRFALRLRGLDDLETQEYHLVAQPAETGRADALTVLYNPAKGGPAAPAGAAGGGAGGREQELARFWIDGARLYFRWTAHLTRPLAEAAKALHDCVLEVRGGGVRLNVLLRTPLVEPWGLTVQEGFRAIPARGEWERPVRKLIIRSSEVKIGGLWKDLADQVSPSCRQLTVGPAEEKEKEKEKAAGAPAPPHDPLVLSVALIEEGKKLHPELEPSVKKLKTQRDRFHRETLQWRGQVVTKTAELDAAQRARDELPLRHRQALLLAAQQGAVVSPLPPLADLLAQATQRIEERTTERKDVVDQYRQSLEREEAQKRLETECGEYRSAPIRVRLGMIVDGEEVDIARLGP